MNTLERRQIVRSQLIDASVAKTTIGASRRQSGDATKKLRKAMVASYFNSAGSAETVAYPRRAAN